MPTPIDNIADGHEFQRIVAEYFRCLRKEKGSYQIADILVEDGGVGPDDGVDILVEFYFEDVIGRHSHRWVVECKCHQKAISRSHVNLGSIPGTLQSNNAQGYLLVCKNDATASLKREIKRINEMNGNKYIVWNGTQLWRKLCEYKSLIEDLFPGYYRKNFVDNNSENDFKNLIDQLKTHKMS